MSTQETDMVPIDTEHRVIAVRLVEPLATIEETRAAVAKFKDFRDNLLTEDDWQLIHTSQGDKKFPKKSGRAALDIPFCTSHEIKDEERLEYPDGSYAWKITVRAHHPSGRYEDGDGFCHSDEDKKKEHDVRATAVTRAKNRASFDLYGLGTVSAEEMVGDKHKPAGNPRSSKAGGKFAPPDGFVSKPSFECEKHGLDWEPYKVTEATNKKGGKYWWCHIPEGVWEAATGGESRPDGVTTPADSGPMSTLSDVEVQQMIRKAKKSGTDFTSWLAASFGVEPQAIPRGYAREIHERLDRLGGGE